MRLARVWLLWPVVAGSASQKVLINGGRENPFNGDFEELAIKQLEDFHVPGIAVAVVDGFGDDTWAAVS
jgi:hypothetical protein